MRRMIGVVLGGLVVGAGVGVWGQQAATRPAAAKLPFTISKETTAITGPLRADGTVDYVAALNEKYGKGVTPENNGFVAWLRVVGTDDNVISPKTKAALLKLCGATGTPAGAEVWVSYPDYLTKVKGLKGDALNTAAQELGDAGRDLWSASDYPNVATFLQAREKLLALAAGAAAKPRWWCPKVASDGRTAISILLPSLGLMREVGNALCARATLRAANGDVQGFLSDIVIARELARGVGGGSTLIERLVGVALEVHAVEAIAAVAAHGQLTVAQCKVISEAGNNFTPMPDAADAMDVGERWMELDTVAVVATGGSALLKMGGDSDNDQENLARVFGTINREAVDWDKVLAEYNSAFSEETKRMRLPALADELAKLADFEQQLTELASETKVANGGAGLSLRPGEARGDYTERIANNLMTILIPSVNRAEELSRRGTLQAQMAEMVVAAAEMKAKNGTWPVKAEELMPGMLKELPRDIYSASGAAPVKYLVTKAGVRVYAVGPNGKDDGGVNDRAKGLDDIVVGAHD